jgi:hypothetical protein
MRYKIFGIIIIGCLVVSGYFLAGKNRRMKILNQELSQNKGANSNLNLAPTEDSVMATSATKENQKNMESVQNETVSISQFNKTYKNTKIGYQFNYDSKFYTGVFMDMDMNADLPEELRNELQSNPDYSGFLKTGMVFISSSPLPDFKDSVAVEKSGFDESKLAGAITIYKNYSDYKKDIPPGSKKINSYSLRGYSCDEYEVLDKSQMSIQGECVLGNNHYSYYYFKKDGIPFDSRSIILF